MLFPSEQTSRPHAWRMTSRETSRPRDRTPRRTTSQAACRRTEAPLMAKKHRIRKKSSAPMRPCARRRKKRRPRTGAIQEEASRRTRSTVGDFRIRCFFAIRGAVGSSEAMARARRMRGWAARAASATHGANPAQPRRAGKTPNATERVPKRPFSTNVSRETSAAVTRAPTATQTKTPAPRSGTGASCAKRRAVYTSATQRPCRLQYSYTLRASSPSAMAKSATGASSGVSSTIW